jgi:hypothetical protein
MQTNKVYFICRPIKIFIISRPFLHRTRNISDKTCKKNQNTRSVYNNFFFENRAIYEIMWKNIVERIGPQVIIYAGWELKCETERCHGEATRSVLAKVRGDVFAPFHSVAAKRRSWTRNSHFGCWDWCFALPQLLYWWRAPVRNILDTTS